MHHFSIHTACIHMHSKLNNQENLTVQIEDGDRKGQGRMKKYERHMNWVFPSYQLMCLIQSLRPFTYHLSCSCVGSYWLDSNFKIIIIILTRIDCVPLAITCKVIHSELQAAIHTTPFHFNRSYCIPPFISSAETAWQLWYFFSPE